MILNNIPLILLTIIGILYIISIMNLVKRNYVIFGEIFKLFLSNNIQSFKDSNTYNERLTKLGISIIVFMAICIIGSITILFIGYYMVISSVLISLLLTIITFLIIVSYLVVLSKTYNTILEVNDKYIATRIIPNIIIPIVCIYYFKKSININIICTIYMFIIVFILYCTNFYMLFRVIDNPFRLIDIKKNSTNKNIKIVRTSSILLILSILINLFLGVLIIEYSSNGYRIEHGSRTIFKMFYYTFTTGSCSDIYPQNWLSRMMGIVIMVTSIVCFTIFLSIIISLKLNKDNEIKEHKKELKNSSIKRKLRNSAYKNIDKT